MIRQLLFGASLALLLAGGPALAGRPCEDRPLEVHGVQMSMALAERTARRLDDTGAQVVVLARAGQDLSRYGLRGRTSGFAYRDANAGRGAWRVVHKLNHCATSSAAVYRQGLGEFFLDRPWRYEAAVVVLAPEVQAKLLPVLRDNRRATQWHTEAYNMLAYPWALTYQQSNQWAIETLAGAMDDSAATRRQAQAWLQLHDYQPTVLHLGPLARLGARATRANVAFDDHPNDKRFSRPHRDGDCRFGVRLAAPQRSGRRSDRRAMNARINRRHALCCSAALAAGLFTSLATPASAFTLSEGLRNPCLGALPRELAQHDLVLAAFEGIDANALWDAHCHLLGNGDAGSGCTISASMHEWWRPTDVLRRRMIMNAACVADDAASVDRAYVQRLVALACRLSGRRALVAVRLRSRVRRAGQAARRMDHLPRPQCVCGASRGTASRALRAGSRRCTPTATTRWRNSTARCSAAPSR